MSASSPPYSASRNVTFADLHIHVGRSGGRPVKITASSRLTVAGILEEATGRKGLDVVGIIDSHSPPVLCELEKMVTGGRLQPLSGGGLRYSGPRSLLLLLGCEIEVHEDKIGPVHYLSYFPDLETARAFSAYLTPRVTNAVLSSQKARLTGEELARWLGREGGFLVPAHIFTPHKGFFGQGGTDLGQCFSDRTMVHVPAVELGLSADTAMAEKVPSLTPFTFLSNSDAHSPETIGREHNLLILNTPEPADFASVAACVRNGAIAANYGLDPRLGKYHRSVCRRCGGAVTEARPRTCLSCGSPEVVEGVFDRVMELSQDSVNPVTAFAQSTGGDPGPDQVFERPPYVHHVPLRYVPGVGPAAYRRLLERFETEMRVLHEARPEELALVVGDRLAARISAARSPTAHMDIHPGGGGRYGRVSRHIKRQVDE